MGFIKRGDPEQIRIIKKDDDDNKEQVNKVWKDVRKEAKSDSDNKLEN